MDLGGKNERMTFLSLHFTFAAWDRLRAFLTERSQALQTVRPTPGRRRAPGRWRMTKAGTATQNGAWGRRRQAAAVSGPPAAVGQDEVTDTGDIHGSLKNERKENEKRSQACKHRRPKRKLM